MTSQDRLRHLEPPMQQRLSYEGTNLRIFRASVGGDDFVAELTSKSSVGSGALEPSRDLARVVGTPPPSVKAAVPEWNGTPASQGREEADRAKIGKFEVISHH